MFKTNKEKWKIYFPLHPAQRAAMKELGYLGEMRMKDNRGTELKIGQTVIYNRSGELVTGEIIGFSQMNKMSLKDGLVPSHIKVRCTLLGKYYVDSIM